MSARTMTTRDNGVRVPTGPVWMLWHGGPGYVVGYVADHTERLDSADEVVATMLDRYYNRDGSTPCVDESSEAHIFFRDPRDELDPYPDARVVWSHYHNRYVWDHA